MYNLKVSECKKHLHECYESNNTVPKETKSFLESMRKENHRSTYTAVKTNDEIKYQCTICKKQFFEKDLFDGERHACYIQYRTYEEVLEDNKIFVYDIESFQDSYSENKLVHECILICIKNVYTHQIWQLNTIKEFYATFLVEEFSNATFIAHNAGGYDMQFLLVEAEREGLIYEQTPRPSSEHKYLEMKIFFPDDQTNNDRRRTRMAGSYLRFIDFMMLVPGSLRNIAKAFQLPVQKGDFPHRFLSSETINYDGPLPPLYSEKDYFCFNEKKTEEDKLELIEFYEGLKIEYCSCDAECSCTKRKWNCLQFLTEYCWKDVEVLCQCVYQYRQFMKEIPMQQDDETGWVAARIDPLLCMTQSQLAMRFFCQGWSLCEESRRQHMFIPKQIFRPFHWKSISWMESLQSEYYHQIEHIGNCGEYPYLLQINEYVDGLCLFEGQWHVFIYEFEGFKISMAKRRVLQLKYRYVVHVMKDAEWNVSDDTIHRYKVHHEDREFFYGGRTEVFSCFADADLLEGEIEYHDVCSLYPYICSFRRLPIGKPSFIFGNRIRAEKLNPDHPNRYFGYAKVKIIANRNDRIGLLPSRDVNSRLQFHVLNKIGWWHTEEIYLAIQNGYVIDEVYQVIHFNENETSNTYFRGYMQYWLQIKLECEGWKKDRVCLNIYRENGYIAKPRKENVRKNPVLRQIAKIFLNCLWGKLCQDINTTCSTDIFRYQDVYDMLFRSDLNPNEMKLRVTATNVFKLNYTKEKQDCSPNPRFNLFVGASVTAWARCYLQERMLFIGADNLLYCDTDSIIFHRLPDAQIPIGKGLGNWTNEYEGKRIKRFYAIAPKFYTIFTDDGSQTIKCKGIWLTIKNRELLKEPDFQSLIQNVFEETNQGILLDNMTIFSNTTDINLPYGTMVTVYNQKKVKAVLKKREIILEYFTNEDESTLTNMEKLMYCLQNCSRINLYPIGYQFPGSDDSGSGLESIIVDGDASEGIVSSTGGL